MEAWLEIYAAGAVVMLVLTGASIARGAKFTTLEIVFCAAIWPILLPLTLGVMLLGSE